MMEASQSNCSDELRDIFCEPCGKDRQTNLAEGFCADCSEYLCGQCYKYHKRFRQFEHHVLQDKNNMPLDPMHNVSESAMSKDVCITKCRTHTDKVVEYICMSCDLVGCQDCITDNHGLCESVRHVPIVVKKTETLVEIQGFARKLDAMNENVKELQNKISKNFDASDSMTKKALSDLGQQKLELFTFFERLFEKLKSDLKEKQNTDNQVFTDCLKELTVLYKDLQKKIVWMSNLEKNNQNCEIFIFMKDTQTLFKKMKSDMETLSRNGQEAAVRYDRSIEIDEIIDEIEDVGYLVFGESERNKTNVDSKKTKMEKVINSLNRENQDFKNDIGRMQAQVNDLCKQNTQLKTQVEKEKTALNTEIQILKQGYEARLNKIKEELRTKEMQQRKDNEELNKVKEGLRTKEMQQRKDQEELNKLKVKYRTKEIQLKDEQEEVRKEQEIRRKKDEALRKMEGELRTKETQLKQEQEELRRIQEILRNCQDELRAKEELRKKDQEELNKVKKDFHTNDIQLKKEQEELRRVHEERCILREELRRVHEKLQKEQQKIYQLENKTLDELRKELNKKEQEEAKTAERDYMPRVMGCLNIIDS